MSELEPSCQLCEPERRGYDMLRAGDVSRPTAGPAINGVHLAAEVGFRAPDGHLKLWLALARGEENGDGPCCAPERIELTLMQMIEHYMRGLLDDEERGLERAELAAYLHHLAGWIERGCNARG